MVDYKSKSYCKNICRNCGKGNHSYSNCCEPVLSYGVILFKPLLNKDEVLKPSSNHSRYNLEDGEKDWKLVRRQPKNKIFNMDKNFYDDDKGHIHSVRNLKRELKKIDKIKYKKLNLSVYLVPKKENY